MVSKSRKSYSMKKINKKKSLRKRKSSKKRSFNTKRSLKKRKSQKGGSSTAENKLQVQFETYMKDVDRIRHTIHNISIYDQVKEIIHNNFDTIIEQKKILDEDSDANKAKTKEPDNALINFKLTKELKNKGQYIVCTTVAFECDYKLFTHDNDKYKNNIITLLGNKYKNNIFMLNCAKFLLSYYFLSTVTEELGDKYFNEMYNG
jgi:hypothetical protein